MGKEARIKRFCLKADRVDAIGEAYIHALEQLMAGEPGVTIFGHPVATGDDASLVLQRELEQEGINLEELLRVVRHEHQAGIEM